MEIGGGVCSLNEITQKCNHSNERTNGIGFCSLSTVTHKPKHSFVVSSQSVKPLFFYRPTEQCYRAVKQRLFVVPS
jgi:hypothetical protein